MRAKAPAPRESWWQRTAVLFRPPRLQWAALSVAASIIVPLAGVQYHNQRQRVEGEKAREQLVLAVRVAGSKLHRVQRKVLEMGRTDTRI